ncbi:Protein of unknown function [Gryllus bimaculatus]|nr:Protein of unknown function [Gryllus bimaculatus]
MALLLPWDLAGVGKARVAATARRLTSKRDADVIGLFLSVPSGSSTRDGGSFNLSLTNQIAQAVWANNHLRVGNRENKEVGQQEDSETSELSRT